MIDKTVVCAVIGCGYWGPNLIRNLYSLPKAKLKMVVDKSPDRLAKMKELYPNIQTTSNVEDVLNDPEIDAVAIATPVFTHYKLAVQCMNAGKHVFVEKPLASSSVQCDSLISLATQKGLTLMVGHTFLYTNEVRKLKEIVDSGEIGKIYYISCQRLNLGLYQKDINVAWDLAPHDLSIILYIMGKSPVSVNCQGKAHITPGIQDVTIISLDFGDDKFATVQSSWLDPNKIRKITIVGSEKMIVYDDLSQFEKIKIYDKSVKKPLHFDSFSKFYSSYADFQYDYHNGDIHVPFVASSEPLRTECQHFIDCVYTGANPLSSGRQGHEIVKILEASNESLKLGGSKVYIPS